MALPVIKIDSATGSDTQASGAGPDTALFGSSGVSAGDGLSVNLSTDNPDLSGVAQDGSAVLFFNDTTAGNKNFVKITNVNNSTKVVTVANALGVNLTKGWAIGGKRSAIGTTLSRKLINNPNNTNGDVQPGWVIEFQSGHSETISAELGVYCSGDATTGPITIRGAAGAAVLPLITQTSDYTGFFIGGGYNILADFELRNSNPVKNNSMAVSGSSAIYNRALRLKIAHPTDCWANGLSVGFGYFHVSGCEIGYIAKNYGVLVNYYATISDCYIHHCYTHGIHANTVLWAHNNIIYANGTDGIYHNSGSDNWQTQPSIIGNVIDSNGRHGISFFGIGNEATHRQLCRNNSISNNGGYGMYWDAFTAAKVWAAGAQLQGNNHYNNTSDAGHLTNFGAGLAIEEYTSNVNPAYTDAANGDFSSTALRELGYPLGGSVPVGRSNTYTYPDIGMQSHVAPGALRAASRKRAFESKHVINY